jgi:hypothetical protein
MADEELEAKAIALWVAAADAVVKGGALPLEGGWKDEAEDVKAALPPLGGRHREGPDAGKAPPP